MGATGGYDVVDDSADYDVYDTADYYYDGLSDPDSEPAGWDADTHPGVRRPVSRVRRLFRALLVTLILLGLGFLGAYLAFTRLWDDEDESSGSAAQAPTAPSYVTPAHDWPANVIATPHTVPARIRNTLRYPAEQHGYELWGSAGQVWRIRVVPLDDSALDPLVVLYDPAGLEVARADDQADGELTAVLRVTLAQSGAYRVLVQSAQGGITTGSYLFTLSAQ